MPRRSFAVTAAALAVLGGVAVWASNAYGPHIVAYARNITIYDRSQIRFSLVQGTELAFPTSIQIGPDARLYVAEEHGVIYSFRVERGALGSIRAADRESVDLIAKLPNHDDDGSRNAGVPGRLITGLLAFGEPDAPGLFVSSSDPRVYHPEADTNSGVVSLLRRGPAGWSRRDLVCGLPRSHADHATNGLYFDEPNRMLYVLQGGNTNAGAPEDSFNEPPEYALSGALLKIDLARLPDDGCFNLPTLDDPRRPGEIDENDPFGGAQGNNQAIDDPAGPVTLYATGLRNAYRLVRSGDRFLTIDNGANQLSGGMPVWQGDQVTNERSSEPVERYASVMLRLREGGYYGHPNPTRADRRNTFSDQNPTVADRPDEAFFIAPERRPDLVALFDRSVNGLAWYPVDAGPMDWRDRLVVVGWDRVVRLMHLDDEGLLLDQRTLVAQAASTPLDVAVSPSSHPLPGIIWINDYTSGRIIAIEPITGDRGFVDYAQGLWREGLTLLQAAVFSHYDVQPGRILMRLPPFNGPSDEGPAVSP